MTGGFNCFPIPGGSTATALALGKAKTEFQQNPSSRNAKVIWFFSDGRSNTGGSPVPVAKQLKAMGKFDVLFP